MCLAPTVSWLDQVLSSYLGDFIEYLTVLRAEIFIYPCFWTILSIGQ